MKTILLAIGVSLLTATLGYGQVDGAAAALERYKQSNDDWKERQEKRAKEDKKNLESGRSLFGADERWGKDTAIDGTLKTKEISDFKIGDWGCTNYSFQVINRVSKTECLVEATGKELQVMLLRGIDMSKVTDGAKFVLQYPVFIRETYSYTSVGGAQKTVLVLERNDAKIKEIIDSARAAENQQAEKGRKAAEERARVEKERKDAIEAARWHTWTDSSGTHKIDAKFGGMTTDTVTLVKHDGSTLKIPLENLSDEDQKRKPSRRLPRRLANT